MPKFVPDGILCPDLQLRRHLPDKVQGLIVHRQRPLSPGRLPPAFIIKLRGEGKIITTFATKTGDLKIVIISDIRLSYRG